MGLRPWSVGVFEPGSDWYEQLAARFHAAPAVVLPFGWPSSRPVSPGEYPYTQALIVAPPRDVQAELLLELVSAWRQRYEDTHLVVLLPATCASLAAPLRTLLVHRVFPSHVPPPRLAAYLQAVFDRSAAQTPLNTRAEELAVRSDPVHRHDAGLPLLDPSRCRTSGRCVQVCPTECLTLSGSYPLLVRPDQCVRCGLCVALCPTNALALPARDTGRAEPRSAAP